MKFIPLQVCWKEGNKTHEKLGAMHYDGGMWILPTSKEDEVLIYVPLFPEGIRVKGDTVHYVSLLEACSEDVEYEYEEKEDEQGEEGIEPVPE
jgi:hypothetical protein